MSDEKVPPENGPVQETVAMTTASSSPSFGPYRVEMLLGQGGMGEVYRALDTRLGRRVAVKLVRPEMSSRSGFRDRFAREARATSALNHPHICTVYDIGEQEGVAYLVMEFVEGETLAARLRQGPLPYDLVLRYGAQTANALAAAHARDIIHRDLKPSNLMITPFGIKVLDFGLAKIAGPEPAASSEPTAAHLIMGTPAYMSPEQARGEPLDGRSDIFALGCVLYQAATGVAPFGGNNVLSTLHAVATVVPPPATSIRPELPKGLDSILERALAKDRESRYASASDFERALAALQTPAAVMVSAPEEREPEPLVGRERELERLQMLLEKAAGGTGGMALLMGAPGMGKTALAGSFLFSAVRRHPGLLTGRGTCVEHYGTGEAYLPFLEALSGLLAGPSRERIMAVLRRQAPTWCLQFPAVFSGSSLDNLQLETIGANKERMLREFGDALSELTATGPLVLLLEDLHWADPSSIDLLRHLGQRVTRQKLLIVGTARPEELERENHPLRNCKRELQGHAVCEEISLWELTQEQVSRYLETQFPAHAFPPEFARLIYTKTEGHPLFLTGATRFLTEHGEIVKNNGAWTLSKPASDLDLQVPESVHNMIRKQLELLSEDDQRTLQYASVEGEEFSSPVLAALLGLDELELEERLARIEKVHRLIRTRGEEEWPDGSLATRYRFAHALYQNILYEGLLNKRRSMLHRQAGETLAKCYAKETARVAHGLAMHFERGRDFPRAIEYLAQAADVAISRYASEAAEEHCSRALKLAEKLPADERGRTEIALLYKRGRNRQSMYRPAEAGSDFKIMLAAARSAGDRVKQYDALIGIALCTFGTHELQTTETNAQEALSLADEMQHQGFRALSKALLGANRMWVGELEVAKPLLDESIASARQANDVQALLPACFFRGFVHFFQSEYQHGERVAREAIELASALRDGFFFPFAQFQLGLTLGNQGRMSEALEVLEQALETSRRNNNVGAVARIPNCIAWIHAELQDFETAARLDRECAQSARTYVIAEGEGNSKVNLISDYTHRGEFDKAIAAMSEAKAISEQDSWMQWRYIGIRLPAHAAEHWLHRGDLAQAGSYAQTLLENATRTQARKYIAIAHRLRGEIARAAGDNRAAEAELTDALHVLRGYPTPLTAWKIHVSLARLRAETGRPAAARESYAEAAAIVEQIAASIGNDKLRETFRNSAAIQEIFQQSQ